MNDVFTSLLKKGASQGMFPARTAAARDWFRTQAQRVGTTSPRTITNSRDAANNPIRSNIRFGEMYFFYYDAKMKKELPYWDKFPLIFPVEPAPGGFYGLNFHYLPYPHRARFMDALYDLIESKTITEKTKMQLSYQLVKNVSNTPYYKTCLKHYLNTHVRSNFYYVSPQQWDIALFLPVESFQNASKRKVFADSAKALNG